MAPHSMETILQPPNWPASFSHFVTWCLMWDPRNRPTSAQALNHEYFADAVDPLRPKSSSTTRLLGRKHSTYDTKSQKDATDIPPLTSKPSWFRKSLIARDSAPAITQLPTSAQRASPRPSPNHANTMPDMMSAKPRANASKRATWTNGATPSVGAPMPILPSIRPISPLSATVTAQGNRALENEAPRGNKKIGRQLSVASNGSHYADIHRLEAERALNGYGSLASPTSGQKESFFSHLRKRARRLSGRHQIPISPKYDDIEAQAGCGPWQSNRSSMALDPSYVAEQGPRADFTELDKALQNVRYGLEASTQAARTQQSPLQRQQSTNNITTSALKRHHSITSPRASRSPEESLTMNACPGPISSRTRRALQLSTNPSRRYDTPDEEDELLDEALHNVQRAVRGMDRIKEAESDISRGALRSKDINRQPMQPTISNITTPNPYPTPSPSAKRNGLIFGQSLLDQPATPLNIVKPRQKDDPAPQWPTPPYEENEWAASAAASIFAAGSIYR